MYLTENVENRKFLECQKWLDNVNTVTHKYIIYKDMYIKFNHNTILE